MLAVALGLAAGISWGIADFLGGLKISGGLALALGASSSIIRMDALR